jgi:hypothetical protein
MNASNLTLLVVATGGVGLGVASTALMDGRDDPEPVIQAIEPSAPLPGDAARAVSDSEQLAVVVESLAALLDEEIRERNVMAEEIRELKEEVQRLRGASAVGNISVNDNAVVAAEARQARRVQRRADQGRKERLIAAGFSEREVDALERRAAEATMERMMLDDRARREGWANTPRYWEEIQAIESEQTRVRSYLGDDAYDRYLFASGNPNRLSVQSVIATSPAEQAGLEAGDILLSYGDQRLFDNRQLRELRSGGQPGEPVTMEIMRDGETMEITIPRGPLGVQINPTFVDPNEGEVPGE